MCRKLSIDQVKREAEDSPVAWFAVLERARHAGDFETAAEAVRALAKLGIRIAFGRARTPRREKGGRGQ